MIGIYCNTTRYSGRIAHGMMKMIRKKGTAVVSLYMIIQATGIKQHDTQARELWGFIRAASGRTSESKYCCRAELQHMHTSTFWSALVPKARCFYRIPHGRHRRHVYALFVSLWRQSVRCDTWWVCWNIAITVTCAPLNVLKAQWSLKIMDVPAKKLAKSQSVVIKSVFTPRNSSWI